MCFISVWVGTAISSKIWASQAKNGFFPGMVYLWDGLPLGWLVPGMFYSRTFCLLGRLVARMFCSWDITSQAFLSQEFCLRTFPLFGTVCFITVIYSTYMYGYLIRIFLYLMLKPYVQLTRMLYRVWECPQAAVRYHHTVQSLTPLCSAQLRKLHKLGKV